jgi:hypothetical protein
MTTSFSTAWWGRGESVCERVKRVSGNVRGGMEGREMMGEAKAALLARQPRCFAVHLFEGAALVGPLGVGQFLHRAHLALGPHNGAVQAVAEDHGEAAWKVDGEGRGSSS